MLCPFGLLPSQAATSLPMLQGWLRDVHQLRLPGGGMQIADCFDLDDARRSYFGQLFPLSECGRALRVRQVGTALQSQRHRNSTCTASLQVTHALRVFNQKPPTPPAACTDPGGIVPAGPTAADLGLHLPPGRGPVDFQEVFHFKPAGGR